MSTFTLVLALALSSPAFGIGGYEGFTSKDTLELYRKQCEEIKAELEKNPAMDEATFVEKTKNIHGQALYDLQDHYRTVHLAEVSPLKEDERVLAGRTYVGYVRYIFPKGRRAAIQLDGYGDKLYSYSRGDIAKEITQIQSLKSGDKVSHPGRVHGRWYADVAAVFEGNMACISYDGYDGLYAVHSSKLRKE